MLGRGGVGVGVGESEAEIVRGSEPHTGYVSRMGLQSRTAARYKGGGGERDSRMNLATAGGGDVPLWGKQPYHMLSRHSL